MIRRVTPSRHASLDSQSSCCGFNHKKELKGERHFEVKPKSLMKNLTLSTPYRDLTIVEDELDHELLSTPKPSNPIPMKLFPCDEKSMTLPSSNQKAPSSVLGPTSHSFAIIADDGVGRPLERLKNRRKNSHISDPLSISCNNSPSIKFSYLGKATRSTNKPPIILDTRKNTPSRQ
jgi:hypothetical protein